MILPEGRGGTPSASALLVVKGEGEKRRQAAAMYRKGNLGSNHQRKRPREKKKKSQECPGAH